MTAKNPRPSGRSSFEKTSWETVPFENISEPGAYVCQWSGHLLRIPDDALAPGRSPLLAMVGQEPLYVTKISDDPYITKTKARLIASDSDIHVNF